MANILIIDDDQSVRSMLRQTLSHFGHVVIEACNGNEGLALFAQIDPDLVITDIVIPEKEGLEVLMALRTKQPPVRIIAISGGGRQNSANYLRIAKLMGATKVLAKPFSNTVLMTAIDELLMDCEAPPAAGDVARNNSFSPEISRPLPSPHL